MADILKWGFVPSCDLHFSSLQDGDVRHDFFVQSCTISGWRNVHRLTTLSTANLPCRTFDCSNGAEFAQGIAERLARAIFLDATMAGRATPVPIDPSVLQS